jgi:hypothetical protein
MEMNFTSYRRRQIYALKYKGQCAVRLEARETFIQDLI